MFTTRVTNLLSASPPSKICTLWSEGASSDKSQNRSTTHQPVDCIRGGPKMALLASEVMADRIEFLTSDRRVNEALLLTLLDLLVAHLTD